MPAKAIATENSSGRVHSLHIKPRTYGERGIPKRQVAEANVEVSGLEGDFNVFRQAKKNGTADRAVLIISRETLEELASEGWPVSPGDLGENITIERLDYKSLKVGDRLSIGAIEIEITEPCMPCVNLKVLPYIGESGAAKFIKTLLGRRGWYAKVTKPGIIKKGESVTYRGILRCAQDDT